MNESELQQYLYDHIPLSKNMQVGVIEIQQEGVILSAPLAPNINHRETVFGGSASAVAILAAWCLVHTGLAQAGIISRLLIQRNTMDYLLPINGTFSARSFLKSASDWEKFLRMFARKGRARIQVSSELIYSGQIAGTLQGEFVALSPEE